MLDGCLGDPELLELITKEMNTIEREREISEFRSPAQNKAQLTNFNRSTFPHVLSTLLRATRRATMSSLMLHEDHMVGYPTGSRLVIRRFTRKRVDFWIFGRFSTEIHVEMTVRWIGGTKMTTKQHLHSAPPKKLPEEHAPWSRLYFFTRNHSTQGSMQNLGVVSCKDAVPMSFQSLDSLSGSCWDDGGGASEVGMVSQKSIR